MKNQTFGIELEICGLDREQAAHALAEHFGTRAIYIGNHLDNWHVPMPDGRHWTVESDSSIEPTPGKARGTAECVSPVCTWDDIPMVQEVARCLRAAGAYANESCGIHVHVGLGEHTPKTLRNLVNLVASREDLLARSLQISSHRLETWCQPVSEKLLNRLNAEKPTNWDDFAEIWYDTNHDRWRGERSTLAGRRAHHYDPSRYHLLNLHATFSTERPAHTIEFRAFNGTLHAGKIKAYIQLCMAMSYQALASKSISPKKPETDNPKYTFRCWLLRLGFIGDEFATAREHLTKNLLGDSAWRDPNHR